VPFVLSEKGEETFECFVRNVDTGVLLFQCMQLEQPAIEVGNFAEQLFQVTGALGWLLGKTLMEQPR